MLISGYLQPIPDLSPAYLGGIGTLGIESAFLCLDQPPVISFSQSWDAYGAFSNFSPHFITVISSNGEPVRWKTVEHYYQVIL